MRRPTDVSTAPGKLKLYSSLCKSNDIFTTKKFLSVFRDKEQSETYHSMREEIYAIELESAHAIAIEAETETESKSREKQREQL